MIFAYDLISRFSSSQYQHIFHLCSPNYALFCLNLIRFFNTMLQPHFWGQPFLHSAQLMCITFLTFCRRKGFFFFVATEYQIICFNISRVNLMDKKSDNRVFFLYMPPLHFPRHLMIHMQLNIITSVYIESFFPMTQVNVSRFSFFPFIRKLAGNITVVVAFIQRIYESYRIWSTIMIHWNEFLK